jgi:hypothetical protein
MAVTVKPGAEIEIGPPVCPVRKAASSPLQVVVNWQAELKP